MQFEDLFAWQKARDLTNYIYRMTRSGRLKTDYGLRDQLQRAAVSSMTNLAEGFERTHLAEKIQFWHVAKASAGEVKSLLYVALDNELAAEDAVAKSQALASEVSALTHGLIHSYKSRRPEDPES